MHSSFINKLVFIVIAIFLLNACSETTEPQASYDVTFINPSNFPSPVYDMQSNHITKEGFNLGKKLFYDGILSKDGSISCGTCHIQSSGFSQHGHDLSHGIADRLTCLLYTSDAADEA